MRADPDFDSIIRQYIADELCALSGRERRRWSIAQVVARNIVPLAGILFLGWNAQNVLIVYFADTLLTIARAVRRRFATLRAADRERRLGGAGERRSRHDRRRRVPAPS